jgi:hypothetical protein
MVMARIRGWFLGRRRVLVALFVAVLLVQQPLLPAQAVAAQEAPPASEASGVPNAGAVLLEDPLASPGLLEAGRCPTGRNVGEFVGEGFIMKVTGKCVDGAPGAAVFPPSMRGLQFSDGEVRLEVRAVSGHDRLAFILGVREQAQSEDSYDAIMVPAHGVVGFANGGTQLGLRKDLAALPAARDGWHSLAVRAQGPRLWVLLNDEPIMAATDSSHRSGSVFIGLRRLGDPNDNQESAVVVRNLRISALAN